MAGSPNGEKVKTRRRHGRKRDSSLRGPTHSQEANGVEKVGLLRSEWLWGAGSWRWGAEPHGQFGITGCLWSTRARGCVVVSPRDRGCVAQGGSGWEISGPKKQIACSGALEQAILLCRFCCAVSARL